jgi:hypothetical protein
MIWQHGFASQPVLLKQNIKARQEKKNGRETLPS